MVHLFTAAVIMISPIAFASRRKSANSSQEGASEWQRDIGYALRKNRKSPRIAPKYNAVLGASYE